MVTINQTKNALTGPIASVSTPFNKDGSIDYKSLRNIVDFIIEAGSGTVLLTFGDSLYSILTDREIAEITKTVIEQTAGRAMTVAAGSWWMGESIRFAQFAKDAGADMFMPLPPDWAHSCSVQNLVGFYSQISKEIPVMMVTMIGSRPIPMETIQILLEKENGIVALKDDKCGVYGKRVTTLINGRWAFLSGGRKQNHLEVMPFGAEGYLSVYMRFKPAIAHEYWKAIQNNNIKRAVEIINTYDVPFIEELPGQLGLNFDALIHGAMEIFKISKRWRRNPYMSASDEQMEKIRGFFKELK